MTISKAQLEVWRIRDELDAKLSKMTPAERTAFIKDGMKRLEQKAGLKAHLPPTHGRPNAGKLRKETPKARKRSKI